MCCGAPGMEPDNRRELCINTVAVHSLKKRRPKGRPYIIDGAKRDRTDDLMTASHALSQLSYSPISRVGNTYCQRARLIINPQGMRKFFLQKWYNAGNYSAGALPRTPPKGNALWNPLRCKGFLSLHSTTAYKRRNGAPPPFH